MNNDNCSSKKFGQKLLNRDKPDAMFQWRWLEKHHEKCWTPWHYHTDGRTKSLSHQTLIYQGTNSRWAQTAVERAGQVIISPILNINTATLSRILRRVISIFNTTQKQIFFFIYLLLLLIYLSQFILWPSSSIVHEKKEKKSVWFSLLSKVCVGRKPYIPTHGIAWNHLDILFTCQWKNRLIWWIN